MWPPQYKVRKHRRARSVKLRATKAHGLVVTIPYRFNTHEIRGILEENKNWIQKHLQILQAAHSDELPDKITIAALNQTWKIYYLAANAKVKLIERPDNEIVIMGNIDDKEACKTKLISWVKEKSHDYLSRQLKKISIQTQLSYEKLSVRDQSTLWGSCTSKRNISLNYKLIFLPPELMAHVMIHELCHTKYLNHSERFWSLVAALDPACELNRKKLRHADGFIPKWV